MSKSSIFWGIVLIFVGTLLILNNFGYININIWAVIGPLLLILLGLWVMLSTKFRKGDAEHIEVPLNHIEKAAANINYAAGQLRITGVSDSVNLLLGDLSGGFTLDQKSVKESVSIQLDLKENFPIIVWIPVGTEWNIRLNNTIPFEMDIKTGAVDAVIDLSNIRVKKFQLTTGASLTQLILSPAIGTGYYVIKSGLASVTIQVPSGVSARIRASVGLGIVNVDQSRFPKLGGEYKSIDYDASEAKVDLAVETGLGIIDIR